MCEKDHVVVLTLYSVVEPNCGFDSRIVSTSLRRSLKPVNRSRPSSIIKTDEEASPSSTPEVVRRNLKSLGASAQRSVSYIHNMNFNSCGKKFSRIAIYDPPPHLNIVAKFNPAKQTCMISTVPLNF